MTSLPPWLLLVSVCLFLGATVLARRRRAFVEVSPIRRAFLRRCGLRTADDFLALSAVIVSGHTDRNVGRLTLGSGAERLTVYLKREHRVSWTVRLFNALSGFGLVSRCLREARTLQALQREGIGCPEWLAAGEDRRGLAFLLVREVAGAVDLRTFLHEQPASSLRRRVARRLGRALARLHEAGIDQPNLYAKHVLVDPTDGTIHLIDWQRSRRRRTLDWRRRCRDLAALDATLADSLATSRERLACLRAYLRGRGRQNGEREARNAERKSPPLGLVLRLICEQARRLARRRHIREKQQPPRKGEHQDWICLEGEALCVTPAFHDVWPEREPDWLSLDQQPAPPECPMTTRRWLALANGQRTLLVRRVSRRPFAALWHWLWRRRLRSEEQRQAGLLFRLERHGVHAPRVLAMGQRRRSLWRQESFLLTEPAADAVRLDVWLARSAPTRAATVRRRRVLHKTGALLSRLHEAYCYLEDDCPLAVRFDEAGRPVVVVEGVETVRAQRRRSRRLARRNLVSLRGILAAAGCDGGDVRRFLAGYHSRVAISQPLPDGTPVLAGSVHSPASKAPRPRKAEETAEPPLVNPVPAPGDTLWGRMVRGARRLRQRADWPTFAGPDWPDRIMDVAVTDRFHAKQGRSTGRLILLAPAGADGAGKRLTVYLKRHYQLPWRHGLLAALWPRRGWSPAFQEWDHLEWARRQGVPVPRVVAAAEFIGPWGGLRSVLAVEELTDMLPLHEAIPLAAQRLDAATFRRWKHGLAVEMARLARLLHDRRSFHKDLYLCHFYVARDDLAALPDSWRGRVFLIDLHRLAHHPWTWRLWQLKDLAQLLYSSAVAGLDVRDRLAFWRAYRGPGRRRRGDRWLRGWVLFKWRRYCRHNARRRAAEVRP